MERRHFIEAVGVGALGFLAGCSSGGENPLGDGGTTTTTTSSGDVVTAAPGGNDQTTTMTAASGDGGGGATTVETQTRTQTTTTTVGGGGGETTVVSTPDDPTLGGLDPKFTDNFRFTADYSDYDKVDGNLTMKGAWHGGNFKATVTLKGRTTTMYIVDGSTYIEADGSCTSLDSFSTGVNSEEWVDTSDTEKTFNEWLDRTAEGKTTIDGEAVYVFELSAQEAGTKAKVTYYVSAKTGYLRRVETQGVVLDYYDWGNVPPIAAPC